MASTTGTPRTVALVAGSVTGAEDTCSWRVTDYLADGGFSSVYRVEPANPATRERFGSEARALKCVRGTTDELDLLRAEADTCMAVEGHDNVLAIVTSFTFDPPDSDGGHCLGLVLELAAEDLYQLGDRAAPSERGWAAIFEEVAAGLAHIHARGFVHGDLKPTNLLRVRERFTIADFGISAQVGPSRAAAIGSARTIAYWPPETRDQGKLGFDGVRRPPAEGWRASQGCDIWALAVSMHRLLTGRHITTGHAPEQQYELVCAGRYTVDDRLSTGWRALLTDCLAYNPAERRIRTAEQLRRRLAELVLPEDFAGVPWADGRPRIIAVLPVESELLALYQTKPAGRVQGAFVGAPGLLLDGYRHLVDVVLPTLAQQARDGQRAAARLETESERLRQLERQLAAREDPSTQLVLEAEYARTDQIGQAMAEVTHERDQLRAEYQELVRRLERLELARVDQTMPQPAPGRASAGSPKRVPAPRAAAPGVPVPRAPRQTGRPLGPVRPLPASASARPQSATRAAAAASSSARSWPEQQPRRGKRGAGVRAGQTAGVVLVLAAALLLGVIVAAYGFGTTPGAALGRIWEQLLSRAHGSG